MTIRPIENTIGLVHISPATPKHISILEYMITFLRPNLVMIHAVNAPMAAPTGIDMQRSAVVSVEPFLA